MHNYFTLETGAEARRRAFEREAAVDARGAQMCQRNRSRRWLPWSARSAATTSMRSLPTTSIGALLELGRVPRPVTC